MIELIENPNETADGIFKMIQLCLEKHKLKIKNISGFSADNTNSNFGIRHSVFTNLCKLNPNIVKSNCHAHIIHNCAKHSLQNLDVDVENIVLKLYAHFSQSAKRREELKEFHAFIDTNFEDLLRHVPTRWLSLGPCIDRILRTYPALTSYFLSLGDETPLILQKILFVKDQHEINPKIEVYLSFCSHILPIFEETIKQIEKTNCTVTETFTIFTNFRERISSRIKDKFYGFQTNQLLKKLTNSQQSKVEASFVRFLECTLKYLDKWFDFDVNSLYSKLSPFSLKDGNFPSYENFANILLLLKALDNNIEMDKLYDEVNEVNSLLPKIIDNSTFLKLEVDKKWVFIFNNIERTENIFKVISYILTLPSSSAFCERIFSIMGNKYRDERNRCSTNLINNELLITVNCDQNCVDFFNMVQHDESLLNLTKSQQKYIFKK